MYKSGTWSEGQPYFAGFLERVYKEIRGGLKRQYANGYTLM